VVAHPEGAWPARARVVVSHGHAGRVQRVAQRDTPSLVRAIVCIRARRPFGGRDSRGRASGNESRDHVRAVLGKMRHRQAALLILRSDGLSYAEIAAALSLHAASIGTLLARAEAAFQKEYIKRYGTE